MKGKYSIGLDFGTLSVRALVVSILDGSIAGESVFEYPHGVMTECLPDGTKLPAHFALAHPQDYLDALYTVIPEALRNAGVSGEELCGIGLDVTSPSAIALDALGTPLAFKPEFVSHPHAYIKLWKHHGSAGHWAKRIDGAKGATGWLEYYGGSVNCEFIIPKALETQDSDPLVWDNCSVFCEVGDWLCRELTGTPYGSKMMASCNALHFHGSYPSEAMFREIAPGKSPVSEKLITPKLSVGTAAGALCPEAAARLGLPTDIPVAPSMIDSHASVIGCGAADAGQLVAVLGTSACYMLNGKTEAPVRGSCCVAWEANTPGTFGYESGQTCFGDGLNWVVNTCATQEYHKEAEERGVGLHELLQAKCADFTPGSSGLLVLDWWNGVRSPLKRPELSAVIAGLTLQTRPEDIYHAAMESLCFGARRIVDSYTEAGQQVNKVYAAGGIAKKSPVIMQLLADVLGLEIHICESAQTGALGSAIAGAAAENGDLLTLMERMSSKICASFKPNPSNSAKYDELYEHYLRLSRIFEETDCLP